MKNYRYVVAGLLFLAGMINYLDRAALSVVAPIISADLHLSPSQLGLIFSSFFFGYAAFCFIGGQLADRFGARRVMAGAMLGWSGFCALTAATTGFVSMLLARVAFGVGEGPMVTTTNKVITQWFPRRETGRMIGITFAGQPLGSAVAGPIVGLVALSFGWRVSFVVIGLIGIAWALAWWLLVSDDPARHPRVRPEEVQLIRESRAGYVPPEGQSGTLGSVLRRPSVLAVGATLFAANYVLYFFMSWLPSYLTTAFNMDIKSMAIVTVIPWVCGAVGYVGGGFLADWIFLRTGNGVFARKTVALGGLVGAAACVIAVIFAPNATAGVTLIALANLFLLSTPQAAWGLVQELVAPNRVGVVGGFAHLLSNVSGIIGPTVTGFAVQYLGGYSSSFALAALVALAGAGILAVFVRSADGVVAPALGETLARPLPRQA